MKTNEGKRLKARVMLQLLWQFLHEEEEEAMLQEMVDTHGSGWHAFSQESCPPDSAGHQDALCEATCFLSAMRLEYGPS